MRKALIAGNWKMNQTVEEAEKFFKELAIEEKEAELLICPPYIDIPAARLAFSGTFIKWGAQNVYPVEKGAFTGEISPVMLKELGCTYVICGHSERRQLMSESDEFVGEKVRSVISHGMIPILCVGETLEEREAGKMQERLSVELETALKGLDKEKAGKIVIAYEPIWAIGTGKAATAEDAESVSSFIRSVARKLFGEEAAERIRILYGGSVTSQNISSFLQKTDIDGALIGGASLKSGELEHIYKQS